MHRQRWPSQENLASTHQHAGHVWHRNCHECCRNYGNSGKAILYVLIFISLIICYYCTAYRLNSTHLLRLWRWLLLRLSKYHFNNNSSFQKYHYPDDHNTQTAYLLPCMSSSWTLIVLKVPMTWKIFAAYLKGLSKYRRMAFFFMNYLFSF